MRSRRQSRRSPIADRRSYGSAMGDQNRDALSDLTDPFPADRLGVPDLMGTGLGDSRPNFLEDFSRVSEEPADFHVFPSSQFPGRRGIDLVRRASSLSRGVPTLLERQRFDDRAVACAGREIRREVLFARGRTRAGSRSPKRQWNASSKLKCR